MKTYRPFYTVVTTFDQPTLNREDIDFDEDIVNEHHYVFECDINSDGGTIGLSLSNNNINLYSAETYKQCQVLAAHSQQISHIRFSALQPNTLFSSSSDGTLKIWDTRSSSEAAVIQISQEIFDFDVGYDETLVAVGLEESIQFHDIRSNKKLGQYSDSHSDSVTQVHFNPLKPHILATSSEDGLVCVYDTSASAEDEALVSVMNADCSVRQIGFFGNEYAGLYCLTGTETMNLWHWEGAQRIVSFENIKESCQNFGADINYLIGCSYFLDQDELILFAGSWNGSGCGIRVTPTTMEPATQFIEGHESVIRCYCLRNNKLWTGGEDSRLCCWDMLNENPSMIRSSKLDEKKSYCAGKKKSTVEMRQFKPY